jgi:hypothetical protein
VNQDPHPTEQAPGKPLYASESASTPDSGIRGGSDGEFGPQAGAESLAVVLRDVLDEFDAIRAEDGTLLYYRAAQVFPERFDGWRRALEAASRPAHNDGPTVREAAANDRRWWETEKAGE